MPELIPLASRGFRASECACATCIECCEKTPGWFAPGEAEQAAKRFRRSEGAKVAAETRRRNREARGTK